MDFATNSEYLVWLAKWIGIISLVFVALISVQIMLLRILLVRRQRRAQAINDTWRPILVSCLVGRPSDLPKLEKRDIAAFLVLWNYFHETVKEVGNDTLNDVARRLSLEEWALEAISKGSIREKLLAIQTLGWLKETRGWNELIDIMESASPVTSLCAAKALTRIDARRGVQIFVPLAAVKEHWSYATVGKILKEVGPEIVTGPLIEALNRFEGADLVRLLKFIGIAYEDQAAPVVTRLLLSDNVDVLAATLRAVTNPNDLPVVRELLKHNSWRIRTQAAICLGKLGTSEDIERLTHSAGDQDWWVRYRSAKALSTLPTMTSELLKKIAEDHHNPFGSDIVENVRLEKEAFQ